MAQTAMDIRMRDVASKLVKKFGKTVTVTAVSTGTYDTTTGIAPLTNTTKNYKAVLMSPTSRDYDNQLAVSGDMFLIFAAKDIKVAPQPADKFIVDAITYTVLMVEPTYSGEQAAIYTCKVRT